MVAIPESLLHRVAVFRFFDTPHNSSVQYISNFTQPFYRWPTRLVASQPRPDSLKNISRLKSHLQQRFFIQTTHFSHPINWLSIHVVNGVGNYEHYILLSTPLQSLAYSKCTRGASSYHFDRKVLPADPR